MATHGSASMREDTPHANQTTRTATIIDALKQRAQAVLNDKSIDSQTRSIIRYALETNDPWLAELVRRAEAGEDFSETMDFSQPLRTSEDDSLDDKIEEKIEMLADMICRSGDEPATKSAALLVLMAVLERSTNPKAVANTAKHLAFTRCGELNSYGMAEAQIALLEGELLTALS